MQHTTKSPTDGNGKTLARLFGWLLVTAAAAFCFYYLASLAALTRGGTVYQPSKADVILLPGYLPDTEMLRLRCEKAAELYRQGYAEKILVSGGVTVVGMKSEAESAKKTLLHMGVPNEDILLEERAQNTWENFLYAKPILQENGFSSVLVVTSDYHLLRCMYTARKQGIEVSGAGAKSDPEERLAQTLREVRGVMMYALRQQI